MTNSTKPYNQTPTGRISFNERRDALLEQRTDTGAFEADIDTQELKVPQESTDVKLGDESATKSAQRPDNNPYSTLDTLHTLSRKKPRRTLDDMRKLSEEIKKARTDKKIF
jgi:hypothetical protein